MTMAQRDDVAHNERLANAARARLAATLAEIQARLAPDRLARGAWDTAREHGRDLAGEALARARRKPVATSAIVAAILLFLARKPLWRLAWRAAAKVRGGVKPGAAGEE